MRDEIIYQFHEAGLQLDSIHEKILLLIPKVVNI